MQPEGAEIVTLRTRASALVQEANTVSVIQNNVDDQAAGAFLVRVAGLRKSIVAAFEEPKRKAFETHRAISKLEGDLLMYPLEAERTVKAAISEYRVAEERHRREEQARIAQDLKRKEEDRVIAEAETLQATGHQEEAEALLAMPVVAPLVELEKPKVEGVSTRRVWTWRTVDAQAIKREFLMIDEKKIGQLVRALGPDAVKVVGGIEVLEDRIVAVRA